MCESLTRVEELPSGKRVFYIDVGNLPVDQVEEYMKRMRIALHEPDSYVLPVRSQPHNRTFELEQHLMVIVIFIQVFIVGLALIK
jgi:hypothetical protein